MEQPGAQEEHACEMTFDATAKGPRFLVARRRKSQFKPIRTAEMIAMAKANSSNLANTPRRKKASSFAPIRTPSLMGCKRGKSPGGLHFRDFVGQPGTPTAKRLSMSPSVKAAEKENIAELLNEKGNAENEMCNPFSLSSKNTVKGAQRRRMSAFKPLRPIAPSNTNASVSIPGKNRLSSSKGKQTQPNMNSTSSNLSLIFFGAKDWDRTPNPRVGGGKPALSKIDESFMELSGPKTNSNPRKLHIVDAPKPMAVRMEPQPSTSTGLPTVKNIANPPTKRNTKGSTIPKIVVSKIPVKPTTKTVFATPPGPTKLQRKREYTGLPKRPSKPRAEQASKLVMTSQSLAVQTSPQLHTSIKPQMVEFATQTTPSLQAADYCHVRVDLEELTSVKGLCTPERGLEQQACESSSPKLMAEAPTLDETPPVSADTALELCIGLEKLSCASDTVVPLITNAATSKDATEFSGEESSQTSDQISCASPCAPVDSILTDVSTAPTFDECFDRTQALVTPSHRMSAIHRRIGNVESNPARAMYLSYKETLAHLQTPQPGRSLAISASSGYDLNSKRLQEQISLLFSEDE